MVLRKTLVAGGYDDRAIARLVADGVLVRVRRGAYVDRPVFARLDDAGRHGLRARAVFQQAKTRVVLSHVSGVPEYDAPTWGLDLDDVHVTRMDGRTGRHEAGVNQHCGTIQPGDVLERNGVAVMSPTRVALEVTTVADVESSLVVVNHLLHSGATTKEALSERYALMEHWPHTLHTDIVMRLSDPRIETVGESRSLYLFFQHGLPAPHPQYPIHDSSGREIARVDFAWPELGVFLEFDGKVKYERLLKPGQRASDVVVAEKERESLICRLTGWRCIRITWADLARPAATAALIRAFLFPSASAA
ncbi:type IV toxin-antitoxin system AbiEi family antitoxin domain-containing protein [Nocardioides sp. YIM 152315]|uniref:type IV toxin-antitoxin system AbiEi family antitoxin domain-containing protein n=1 Tax=Nocardioides sp. YIM 152315 TaxID=3031760 RepID=UPI0023DCBEEE|nr:type IV toxin-antitoxin system AbiEi family antitoxin domain-containing protein [Nocardioides sp. YIM 152315]MDF1606209.1 type IV toxin-antitoxin system AbiEi family antitoxin domain-containing protein [Nocardioides sp. YIM 152315]